MDKLKGQRMTKAKAKQVERQLIVSWVPTPQKDEELPLVDKRAVTAEHTTGVQIVPIPAAGAGPPTIVERELHTGPPVAIVIMADDEVFCEPGGWVRPGEAFVYDVGSTPNKVCPDGVRKLTITSYHKAETEVQFEILWDEDPKERQR